MPASFCCKKQQKEGINASQAAHKLKRIKTSMLLFENAPAGKEKYALSCVIETNATVVADVICLLGTCELEENKFATSGCFNVSSGTSSSWEAWVRKAVREIYAKSRRLVNETREVARDETELEIDNLKIILLAPLGETANF